MKTWVIASILLAILLIGGFAFVSALSNNVNDSENNLVEKENIPSCSSCENACTAENNCGIATCGAVTGTGSCDCGR